MNDDIKKALEAIYRANNGMITESKSVEEARGARSFASLAARAKARVLDPLKGQHYDDSEDFFGAFDPSDFDREVERDNGMELRGYANGKQVYAWRFDDESRTSGWGIDVGVGESKQVDESIRITKEGVEECWGDMMPDAATGQGEQMTVNITMPNKQISVTTDSAEEIMSVLKLAGIAVGGAETEPEEPVVTMMPVAGAEEPEAAMVGAPGVTAPEGEAEESEEEESEEEEKKEESVEPQGPAVEEQDAFTMAAAAAAREGKTEFEFPPGSGKKHPVKIGKDTAHKMGEGQEESARILKLAGLGKDDTELEEAGGGRKKTRFDDFDAWKQAAKSMGYKIDRDGNALGPDGKVKGQWHTKAWGHGSLRGQKHPSDIAANTGWAYLDEAKFANAPADTEGEAKVYDKLPSAPGDGGGKPEYGTRQSNIGGENPMALKTLDLDMEESFQVAMGEYRKFVAENIMTKKKVSIKEGQQIAEGGMSDADAIIQDIIRGDIGITDVMNHPKTPAEKYVADILSQIYIEVQEDNPLMHPDDDFEDMLPMIQDRLADQYGSKVEGVTKK